MRWPGRLELRLQESGRDLRVIETASMAVARYGKTLQGGAQRAPRTGPADRGEFALALVILMLGNNDLIHASARPGMARKA